jgi:dTDP-4-amino-4,6-dideoxygalactose transaminase
MSSVRWPDGVPPFRATRPELPPPEAWLPLLEEAYAANWFTNFGVLSLRLEAQLASRWGGERTACVLTANGTSALVAPLIAAGVQGPVVVSAFTFRAGVSAIRMAGCAPWPVDVDGDTWTATPEALDRALVASGAKAAIVVAPFGLPRDFSDHAAVAAAHGALLVIDNASGLGAPRRPLEADRHVMEAYSLHATKPFGVGEGGVVFAHGDWTERLRAAINFGAPYQPALPPWGVNGKMSELHAAVGLAVAAGFSARLDHRRSLVSRFGEVAEAEGHAVAAAVGASVWPSFPVVADSCAGAEALIAAAADLGIEVRRPYRPALSEIAGVRAGPCPMAESLADRVCCYPVYGRRTTLEEDTLIAGLRAGLKAAAQSR